MPDDYVPQADPAIAADPILLRPTTFDRHARAVQRVLGDNQARYPRARSGRRTHPNAGAWAVLKAGNSITAASVLTLGHGIVTLCSRSDGGVLAADGEDVPVANSGSAINAGGTDKVLALGWTDGVWSVCTCDTVDCVNCGPCSIPEKELTLSWAGGSIGLDLWDVSEHGGVTPPGLGDLWGTIPLIWFACLEVGGGAYRIGFGCRPGTPIGTWLLEWGGAAACDTVVNGEYCSTTDATIALVPDYTCNPFHIHFTSGCGTLPGILGTTDFFIDDPDPGTICPPPHDDVFCSVKVLGCNGLPLVGAHVVVKDSGGATLASGDTDSPNSLFAPGLLEGSYWFTVTNSRYADTTFSSVFCSGITVLDMSAHLASGYHCMAGCVLPVADVLHATHPFLGAQTYTYDASGIAGPGWYIAPVSYSYPGCLDCPPGTVTVNSYLLADGTFQDTWTASGHCPNDSGDTPVRNVWSFDSVTCPLSFSMSFDYTFSEEIDYYLFCSIDTPTIVFTE